MSTEPQTETDAMSATVDDDAHAALPVVPEPRRRRIDRGLLIASLAIALGIVIVGYGLIVSVTGDEATKLPDEIENISPVPDAVQVLSQTNVMVDLADLHTGVLVIDGVELETVSLDALAGEGGAQVEPGRQVELPPVTIYDPGSNTLTFTPTEGAPIEELESGLHRVQVIYWLAEEGRARADSYTWTFNVV
ncbi:MAG TPA: hypothetical protein VGK49_07520 [Ilumatobacteraceae bacterium]